MRLKKELAVYMANLMLLQNLRQKVGTYAQGGAVGGSNIGDMVTHLYATTTLSQAQVKSMHPDLICQNNGEERVLIECVYRRAGNFSKRKLGFFIMNPPNVRSVDANTSNVWLVSWLLPRSRVYFP